MTVIVNSHRGMKNGMLIHNLDVADVSSKRCNPILANVTAQLDYMEKRGRLTHFCNETKALDGNKGEQKPILKFAPSRFQTIIFATTDTTNVGYKSEMKLTDYQKKSINLTKRYPTIIDNQMSETLSVSQRTTERDISALQKLGIPKREGKDNDGVWVLL